MNFEILTPRAFAERYETRQQAQKVPRKRRETLNCSRPDSTPGPANRRVLGTHIDPDSKVMEGVAARYAGVLKHAIYEDGVPERLLTGPSRYSERVLTLYCNQLIKRALGKPGVDLISPCLVTYLLGGLTMKALEELAHKACDLMEFFPEPLTDYTLAKSLALVGFGAVPHVHSEEEPVKRFSHFSVRQEYLLNLRAGPSYARILIQDGAYGEALRKIVKEWKDDVIQEVERLLSPTGGEMTELAAKDRPLAPQITDHMFERAVRRVFEKPWADLDLSADPKDAHLDAEVLVARRLIHRLSVRTLKKHKMSAVSLVGISLLTGISVANFTEFAVYDLRRRGETFITAETIEEAIEMLEVHPYFACAAEMRGAATEIRYASMDKAKWALRLKAEGKPLWSTNGMFYVSGLDVNGVPTFKWKPFSLSSD